jgi:hypothetical protein
LYIGAPPLRGIPCGQRGEAPVAVKHESFALSRLIQINASALHRRML